MSKVPNSVFLIIAIVAITGAGILFSMYSSEKERAINSFNEIVSLKKTNELLMNKNSDLMMQMGGIEDQKNKLEEKVKEEKEFNCDQNECLMSAPLDEVFGLAKVKGYYLQEEKREINPDTGEGAGNVFCDRFVITAGSDKLIEDYLKKSPSSFFDKNEKDQPIVNIDIDSIDEYHRQIIEDSDSDNQIDLTILDKYQTPMGFESSSVCLSLISILGAE